MHDATNPAPTPSGHDATAPQAPTTSPIAVGAPTFQLTKAEHESLRSMPFELRVRELATIEYDRRHVYDRIRSAQRRKDFQAGWDACMFLHNVPPLEEPGRASEE